MNNDNFFSIERLVEFGLGMAVAQQMVQSMNHALKNTYIAGSMNPVLSQRMASTFFVAIDGKQAGPFSEPDLTKLIAEGKLSKSTLVWMPGMPKWEVAENVAEVLRIVALSPPPLTSEASA